MLIDAGADKAAATKSESALRVSVYVHVRARCVCAHSPRIELTAHPPLSVCHLLVLTTTGGWLPVHHAATAYRLEDHQQRPDVLQAAEAAVELLLCERAGDGTTALQKHAAEGLEECRRRLRSLATSTSQTTSRR